MLLFQIVKAMTSSSYSLPCPLLSYLSHMRHQEYQNGMNEDLVNA